MYILEWAYKFLQIKSAGNWDWDSVDYVKLERTDIWITLSLLIREHLFQFSLIYLVFWGDHFQCVGLTYLLLNLFLSILIFFFCLFSVNGIFKDFTFNRHVDTEGEEESEANWESSIGIYTLLCVKQTASGKLVYSTGSSARCSVMTHRGRMGWVGERFKREWKFKKIRKKRFHFPKKRFHCCRCRGIWWIYECGSFILWLCSIQFLVLVAIL